MFRLSVGLILFTGRLFEYLSKFFNYKQGHSPLSDFLDFIYQNKLNTYELNNKVISEKEVYKL